MSQVAPAERFMTLEEFRAADFGDQRAELVDGRVVVAREFPTHKHGRVGVNVLYGLRQALDRGGHKDCIAEFGTGVEIRLERDSASARTCWSAAAAPSKIRATPTLSWRCYRLPTRSATSSRSCACDSQPRRHPRARPGVLLRRAPHPCRRRLAEAARTRRVGCGHPKSALRLEPDVPRSDPGARRRRSDSGAGGEGDGHHAAVVARLESGRAKPSTRTLERFAKATRTRLRISFEPDKPRPRAG